MFLARQEVNFFWLCMKDWNLDQQCIFFLQVLFSNYPPTSFRRKLDLLNLIFLLFRSTNSICYLQPKKQLTFQIRRRPHLHEG